MDQKEVDELLENWSSRLDRFRRQNGVYNKAYADGLNDCMYDLKSLNKQV